GPFGPKAAMALGAKCQRRPFRRIERPPSAFADRMILTFRRKWLKMLLKPRAVWPIVGEQRSTRQRRPRRYTSLPPAGGRRRPTAAATRHRSRGAAPRSPTLR